MRAFQELLNRAMTASEDISRLEDAEGNVALITRDAGHPRARSVEVRSSGAERLTITHVVVPPTDVPPSFLPPDIPFFPGLGCTVVRRGDVLNVGWRDSEEVEGSMPAVLRSELERRMGEPQRGGEASLVSVARELDDSASVEWVLAREEPTSPGAAMTQRFEELVTAYGAAGWSSEELPSEKEQVARIVRCVGAGRSSTLVLSSFGGVDSIGLSEVPVP